MKDTPITTHLLEKLGFECNNEEADSDDWLIHELPSNPRMYISSYFEKEQDGREYFFASYGLMCEPISTLKELYNCLEMELSIGVLSKEAFLEIEKKIENL